MAVNPDSFKDGTGYGQVNPFLYIDASFGLLGGHHAHCDDPCWTAPLDTRDGPTKGQPLPHPPRAAGAGVVCGYVRAKKRPLREEAPINRSVD